MPLFALANAGIHVDGGAARRRGQLADHARHRRRLRGRQAARDPRRELARLDVRLGGLRLTLSWPVLAGGGDRGRHRLHRLAADLEPRLPGRAARRGQDRRARRGGASRPLVAWVVFRVIAHAARAPCAPASSSAPRTTILDLSDDVDPERDHIRGSERRAGDAGRVRRLRVPVLRPGRGRRSASCSTPSATTCATSGATCRSTTCTRTRRWRPRRPRPRPPRAAFWEMHDRLLAHQDELTPHDLRALRGGARPRRRALLGRAAPPRATPRASPRTWRSADASGVAGTPSFFINGRRHQGAYDVETLSAAVRHARTRARLREKEAHPPEPQPTA